MSLFIFLLVLICFSIIFSGFAESFLRAFIIRILESIGRRTGIILIGAVNKTDENGIPFTSYPQFSGKQRNPITIAQHGIEYWDAFIKQPGSINTKREKFLNIANWLVENAVFKKDFAVWEFNFDLEHYNIKAPWVSGMAQGQGIQVLVRAHSLTGDARYLEIARKSLDAFLKDINEGGFRIRMENGSWYEEYAGAGGKSSRVLNGMIYTLLGVKEYYKYTKDDKAKEIFNEGLVALKSSLPKYDGKGFTYYDVIGTRAGNFYDKLHVELMAILYECTGEEVFKNYYNKWKRYYKRHFFIREFVLQQPDRSDIIVLSISFIIIFIAMYIIVKSPVLHIIKNFATY